MEEQQKPIVAELTTEPATPVATPPPQPDFKPVTPLELKTNYIYVPNLFFERTMSPMLFGSTVLVFLRSYGLGKKQAEDSKMLENGKITKILGYAFCGSLSPVEIAVYAYVAYNPQTTINELSKKRKLPKRLAERTLGSLIEVGLVSVDDAGTRSVASLDDLLAEGAL